MKRQTAIDDNLDPESSTPLPTMVPEGGFKGSGPFSEELCEDVHQRHEGARLLLTEEDQSS